MRIPALVVALVALASHARADDLGTLTAVPAAQQGEHRARWRWSKDGNTLALCDRQARWTLEQALLTRDTLDELPASYVRKAVRAGLLRLFRDGIPDAPWNVISGPASTTGVAPAPWRFIALGDAAFANEQKAVRTIVHEVGHFVQWDGRGWATLITGTPGFTGISWTTGIPGLGLKRYGGFVTAYARKNHLEDFAECCEFYWLSPDELRRANPAKFAYMRDVVFDGQAPPASVRRDFEAKTPPVLPSVTSLGDTSDGPGDHVTVRGERFMGPADGGWNAVRFRGVKAPHIAVSRSTLHAWVPGLSPGSAPVTVTTQDGRSEGRAFRVEKPWWKFW